MSVLHHPPEDMLLGYASGGLDEATSVLLATHLALCPSCRKAVRAAEAVGGALMEELVPASLPKTAIDAVIARLDEPADETLAETMVASRARPVPNSGATLLPRPLRDYVSGDLDNVKWRWNGVGVHYAPLFKDASGNKLGLLRVAAGTPVPHHGHSSDELTMVLSGGYSDEYGAFARGDVEFADECVKHQPIADADEPCVCLVITRGPLKPTGLVASWLVPFLSF